MAPSDAAPTGQGAVADLTSPRRFVSLLWLDDDWVAEGQRSALLKLWLHHCRRGGHEGNAMNVSEAAATNVLLRALLGMPDAQGLVVTDEDAEQAARFLAERARKTLSEGVDGMTVNTRWARRFRSVSPICERCGSVLNGEAWCQACGEELCAPCWGTGDQFLCQACWSHRPPLIEDINVTSGAL